MAARDSSSEEVDSSSEDSATTTSEDPISVAKARGADLKEPEKAAIARTRKIQRNKAGGKKTVRGQKDPKVSAYQRVRENQNEYLSITSENMLRCDACKETLSKKKSTVLKHINSVKHNDAKRAIQNSKKRDQSLLKFLRTNDKKDNPKGETLPEDMRLFRFDLVETFLSAGIPLSKIDLLRPFLEKYGHRLTAHGNLSQLIPSIIEKEKETLKTEFEQVDGWSVIFDGSTRLGEALAIVVRFVDSEWNVQQRLIKLQVLAKSLKADELAQCLIQSLAVEYTIRPGILLAAMKDGAAVNHAALEQVKFFFPHVQEITCFSHTIDNVGKHFEFRILDRFSQLWVSMFSHSAAVRLAWKTRTGTAMKTYSKTRWWSKWEVMKQVLEYFGDVVPFLRENEQDDLAPATRGELLNIFRNEADAKDLELELAALVDGGSHFVAATYYLEGDGPLIFGCYGRLATVANAVAVDAYPNVEAVASRQANGNLAVFNQLVARTKACITPGLHFFQQKFSQEFHDLVRAFKSARLCCPVQVQHLRPNAASVEELRKFKFLNTDATIRGLVNELPRYLAVADGTVIEEENEKVRWWVRHAHALPNWSGVVKQLLLVQPSSASAERVFSLMKHFFTRRQENALEETVEASVMLCYNGNQRKKFQQ